MSPTDGVGNVEKCWTQKHERGSVLYTFSVVSRKPSINSMDDNVASFIA